MENYMVIIVRPVKIGPYMSGHFTLNFLNKSTASFKNFI